MSAPNLELTTDPGLVWHVGFRPDPWAWADRKYATDNGRFTGRWDDELGKFRTIYTGDSLYACLVEVLASLRPKRSVDDLVMAIDDEDSHNARFPDYPAGTINYSWLDERAAGHALQDGRYCYVTHSSSVAALRRHFDPSMFGITAADFDTSLLKDSAPRVLTRSIARWLFDNVDADGVEFRSRHGDDLRMWAVFERAGDDTTSRHLTERGLVSLSPENPELIRALDLHGIRWLD